MRIGPKAHQGGAILATWAGFAQAREAVVRGQKAALSGRDRGNSPGGFRIAPVPRRDWTIITQIQRLMVDRGGTRRIVTKNLENQPATGQKPLSGCVRCGIGADASGAPIGLWLRQTR
jgi:hypothetical protein